MKNRFIGILYILLIVSMGLNACQTEEELNYGRYYVNGKGLYEQHCQNCHSKEGIGLAQLIPPLTDTTFLKKNKNRLACIIKYGQAGNITVNGIIFEEKMPANDHLADIEIAEIITYISNSFGNKQGLYDAEMAGMDLKNCKKNNVQ